RFRVVPDRVLAPRAVELERVVRRRALPRADGVRVRRSHDVVAERLAREVVVAFDDERVVALGDGRAVPDGLHAGQLLVVLRVSSSPPRLPRIRGPAVWRFVEAYPGCAATLMRRTPAASARSCSSRMNSRLASFDWLYALHGEYDRSPMRSSRRSRPRRCRVL